MLSGFILQVVAFWLSCAFSFFGGGAGVQTFVGFRLLGFVWVKNPRVLDFFRDSPAHGGRLWGFRGSLDCVKRLIQARAEVNAAGNPDGGRKGQWVPTWFCRVLQGTINGCGSKPMVPFWGRCTTHFRTYFSGDWDVHWGYLDFDPWPNKEKGAAVHSWLFLAFLAAHRCFFPTAESFGVSAQIGSGVVRGGRQARFHEGSTRVPPGFREGSTGLRRAPHAVGDITRAYFGFLFSSGWYPVLAGVSGMELGNLS